MKKWIGALLILAVLATLVAYPLWNQEPTRWSALPTSIASAARVYHKAAGRYPLSLSDLDVNSDDRSGQASFAEICARNDAAVFFATDGQRRVVIVMFDDGAHAEVRDITHVQ